jgi:LSD1 subclass zinc finger protein
MADLMAHCPTCQALLRLPPGADTVRCPRCKTVLAVGPDGSPVPVPVAAAALPPRPAVPLPFGRAASTAAAPLEPVPIEVAEEPKKRAKLIQDEDPAEIRQREIREAARREAEEAEERKERRLARLAVECEPARRGVTCLAAAAGFYSAALTLCFLFATAYVVGLSAALSPLLYLAALLGAINWALSVGGLALCVGGPKAVRPMAVSALVFAAAHAVLFVVQLAANLAKFGSVARDVDLNMFQSLLTFQILGSVSNLNVLSEFPGSLVVQQQPDWLGTAGGVLELTRLIMIGMLCQHYASEGKDGELGYVSLRFIVRVFAVVLVVTVVKAGLKLAFENQGLDSGWAKFGAAATVMSSAGLFLTLAVIVYAQMRAMFDTAEIIDANRFGMKDWATTRM